MVVSRAAGVATCLAGVGVVVRGAAVQGGPAAAFQWPRAEGKARIRERSDEHELLSQLQRTM
jgi:hypothetical protein